MGIPPKLGGPNTKDYSLSGFILGPPMEAPRFLQVSRFADRRSPSPTRSEASAAGPSVLQFAHPAEAAVESLTGSY